MLTLETKKKMEGKADSLVEKAKEVVEYKWDVKKKDKIQSTTIAKEIDKAQIRNILDMAVQTDSVKALILFIEYQMGRNRIPKEWGDRLIDEIKGLERIAEEIDRTQKEQIYLEMIRLFLGYLYRYFVYKKGIIKKGGS